MILIASLIIVTVVIISIVVIIIIIIIMSNKHNNHSSLIELADHILAHTAVDVGVRDAQIVVDVLQSNLWDFRKTSQRLLGGFSVASRKLLGSFSESFSGIM